MATLGTAIRPKYAPLIVPSIHSISQTLVVDKEGKKLSPEYFEYFLDHTPFRSFENVTVAKNLPVKEAADYENW